MQLFELWSARRDCIGVCLYIMNSIDDIKQVLLSHIAQEQVAFQFGDGLISFTKPEGIYDSSDIELGLLDEVKQMRAFLSDADSIKEVNRLSLLDDELGFAEFAKWASDKDSLFLIDDGLLICLYH